MANVRTLQRSFGGGEVSPSMHGRIDDAKVQSGLALCRNFIVRPQGPVENRPGLAMVRETKTSARRSRLIPFTWSTTQTIVLEFGHGYIRFHTQGATVMNGAAPLEVVTPYDEADLADIHYVQSADVLTLVHPRHAPRELRRMGPTAWSLSIVRFGAPVDAPTSATATPDGAGSTVYRYVVTAVTSDGGQSAASPVATATNNLFVTGQKNTITWAAQPGATRYRVFKEQAGLFGYIGQSTGTTFVDDNIAPDLATTPPRYDAVFGSEGNFPAAVSYFEQRRCFAGTTLQPQHFWATRSATESDMGYSLPVRDDDRIAFRIAAREANTIRHIVPLSELLLLTSSGEWRVAPMNSDALTPTSVSVRPQSYVGASNVQPVIVNNSLLYGAARGGHVRELGYSWQSQGFVSGDLSLRAAHLFDGQEIVDMAYAKAPQPIVWFVSSSGRLLGLTYIPEQQVGAWHQHDTDGVFESCAVVAEGQEDRLYCVVRRTIGGQQRRFVERMASRAFQAPQDAFFVDCGATYTGAPADHITGLDWLEGATVSILADGAVHPQRQVVGGAVQLDVEASTVQVGLPIQSDLQTLPVALQIDGGFGVGRQKNVNRATLMVERSSGIFIGADASRLVEAKLRTAEPYGAPPRLRSGEVEIVLTPSWATSGQVFVRQSDPLPLTVLAAVFEIAIGG